MTEDEFEARIAQLEAVVEQLAERLRRIEAELFPEKSELLDRIEATLAELERWRTRGRTTLEP
jgi:hypothetical protein